MSISRTFFNWSSPLASQAAAWLLSHTDRSPADLSDWLVLVPGGRLRRSLLDHLMKLTDGRFLPPDVVTPSDFPERLYPVEKPLASRWVQQLAWRKAALSLPPEQLQIVLKQPPADDAFREWMALGQLFADQHDELARDGLDFGHVPSRGATVEGFSEADRWTALAAIEREYLRTLDELGVWDKQTARLFPLLENPNENAELRSRRAAVRSQVGTTKRVALLGATDVSRTVRSLIELAAERSEITALIHAPESEANAFDEFGLLNVPAWLERRVPVEDKHLLLAGRPDDQAEAVGHAIAAFKGELSADDVIVGCPDATVAGLIERRLLEADVEAARSVGRPLDRTSVGTLLKALADHLEQDSSATLGRLLRHPDFERFLGREAAGALAEYDELLSERLLRRIDSKAALAATDERSQKHALAAACDTIETLLADVRGTSREAQGWIKPLTQVFAAVFEDVGEPSDEMRAALEAIQETLGELSATQAGLCPELSAAETIRVVLSRMSMAAGPTPETAGRVEVTGWLELAQDDRPAAIVTGLNEGLIPTSQNEDAFLPNRIRKALDITDNDRRYARDAYALTVVINSRPSVRLIVGRTDGEGKPLQPSRLLFTGSRDEVVRRVRMVTDELQPRPPLANKRIANSNHWAVPVPRPPSPARPLVEVSVTSLRLMLASPTRFWLRYVERLRDVDTEIDELGSNQFGDLVHDVLARFARGPNRDASTADAITASVLDDLDVIAGGRFGSRPSAAVAVQIEQARHRLRRFAVEQATLRNDGWSIYEAEDVSDAKQGGQLHVPFPLPDGRQITLKGFIDRLDRHENGTWRVIDYKTADRGKTPEDVHLKNGEWEDLQLPLYRKLATAWGVRQGDPLEVGYFNLPKSEDNSGVQIFHDCPFDEAESEAADVFIRILDGEYAEETIPEVQYDDFAAILQTDVFGGGKPERTDRRA